MVTGPVRKAFLLGCNSAGLKHCESDAEGTMHDALSRYGYDITTRTTRQLKQLCDQPAGPIGQLSPRDLVSMQVSQFLQTCPHGGTALFYFSGHSLYRFGVFNLVVGGDINAEGHLFSVESLIALFKQHHESAERLLILDCCDAGKVASLVGFWNNTSGDWGRIWVATRSNRHAQELDSKTQGGLFTAFIHRALTTCVREVVDDRGCLRISEVDKFVQRQASNFKSLSGKPAPIPGVFGFTPHDILLADGIEPAITTGLGPAMMQRLADLVGDAGVQEAELARIYAQGKRI